jgi:hypothetical protein
MNDPVRSEGIAGDCADFQVRVVEIRIIEVSGMVTSEARWQRGHSDRLSFED